jgi:hypothetical protein
LKYGYQIHHEPQAVKRPQISTRIKKTPPFLGEGVKPHPPRTKLNTDL